MEEISFIPEREPFLIFTDKLSALGIPYMVSGSVAAIFYREPRLTNAVDIIVFLRRGDAIRIETAFPQEEFSCPPTSVIQMEAERELRGHFNLIHHETCFKADVYISGRDELHLGVLPTSNVPSLGAQSPLRHPSTSSSASFSSSVRAVPRNIFAMLAE